MTGCWLNVFDTTESLNVWGLQESKESVVYLSLQDEAFYTAKVTGKTYKIEKYK